MCEILATADNSGENIFIYPYKNSDRQFVEQLQAKAFGPARFVRAAFRVREQFPMDNNLSFTAKKNNEYIGFVGMTPISINKINGYLLGPLVTHIDYRGLGIGAKLVKKACKKAFENGGEFILLVGDLPYYKSMGFEIAKNEIKFPAPVDKERILLNCNQNDLASKIEGEIEAFIG